jgi:RNA polymerase sigma-70 factor (ECF subfamily)
MSKLGTEEAEQIIRQYSDMIYRIAVHNLSNIADAEDILQDVCISLLTKCPKQRDPDFGTTHSESFILLTEEEALLDYMDVFVTYSIA